MAENFESKVFDQLLINASAFVAICQWSSYRRSVTVITFIITSTFTERTVRTIFAHAFFPSIKPLGITFGVNSSYRWRNSWKTILFGKPWRQMRIPSRTPLHRSCSSTRWLSIFPAYQAQYGTEHCNEVQIFGVNACRRKLLLDIDKKCTKSGLTVVIHRQVTEQRLADQANQIWKKWWFSQAELEEIKQKRWWKVKTKLIRIVVGALGTVAKGLAVT